MLVKSTETVLPMDDATRAPIGTAGRQIGAILMDEGKLTASDAEQVLARQRELGWRFGEAAIELNLITDSDLRQALAKQYAFPYLVSGPEGVSKELIAAWDPFHPVVEELRAVRTQLLIRWYNPEAGRRTLAIASPCAREGRSFVAANLAVTFSQLGQRTLLIDADFRAPRQQGIFNIPDRFGLSSALSGRADLSAASPVSGITGLSVLPAGPIPPNPLELLSRGSFAALLARAQAEYDV
ncbi:MAG TPA: chain length determinant protein tyrosine kinase EpsG, partial [Burkholderiales bacterium]|nr:chain length determinant protein tyrosine kinase EpsG [Burkholderiales bacterium]